MVYCPRCRQSLATGETICPECGYDQRNSVGRTGLSPGLLVLVVLLGLMLIPAAVIAFFVTCYGVGIAAYTAFDSGDAAIPVGLAGGTIAALLVLGLGIGLIVWVFRHARAASHAAQPPPE